MMYLLSLFALLAVSSARDFRESVHRAMENPDLFGGDMLGIDITDRNVVPHEQMRWTDNIVPYELDPAVAPYSALILDAMNNYHANTCIRFVPKTDKHKNYIRIFQGEGCYSYVGMIRQGQQLVSLGNGCMFKGTIVHELGHAIGFFHEQNRSDRDQYLIIYWENIKEGMDTQFFLLKPDQNILMSEFDHSSIMLYGNFAFSVDRFNGKKTMVAKNGLPLDEPYNKKGLTPSDIARVNKMYKCK